MDLTMAAMVEAVAGGVAGACALTALHESARRTVPDAPRMDVLGMRAIERGLHGLGYEAPDEERLHQAALAGDIVSNSLYYSLIGLGRPENAVRNGALLGLLAGVGGVLLPGPMGLGEAPSNRTRATQAMTVAWYLVGGLAAGLAYRYLSNATRR
jgi:hypothetical protein